MKRVLAALLLFAGPVNAQVSSTAAPVANSSGSVTNQAVQVVPSKTLPPSSTEFNAKVQRSTSILFSVQPLAGLIRMNAITTIRFMTRSI